MPVVEYETAKPLNPTALFVQLIWTLSWVVAGCAVFGVVEAILLWAVESVIKPFRFYFWAGTSIELLLFVGFHVVAAAVIVFSCCGKLPRMGRRRRHG